jgi:hypothetical protein
MPSKREAADEFACPETNRRKITALLWAAFPGNSAHAVQQRASLALGKDPRTIRYWMEGVSSPKWHEVGMIAAFAGFERAMAILYGRGE